MFKFHRTQVFLNEKHVSTKAQGLINEASAKSQEGDEHAKDSAVIAYPNNGQPSSAYHTSGDYQLPVHAAK